MNKQTITCKKCGYIYRIDNVSWSVIPPDMNCPNCLPAASVNTSYSGRAINERSEESADTNKTPQWEEELAKTLMEITAKYQTWNYAMNLYSPLKDFIKSTLEAERTRIIKALEGLKVEALMHPMQVLDKERVHQLDNYGAGFDSALDQAIKAVEKGNK